MQQKSLRTRLPKERALRSRVLGDFLGQSVKMVLLTELISVKVVQLISVKVVQLMIDEMSEKLSSSSFSSYWSLQDSSSTRKSACSRMVLWASMIKSKEDKSPSIVTQCSCRLMKLRRQTVLCIQANSFGGFPPKKTQSECREEVILNNNWSSRHVEPSAQILEKKLKILTRIYIWRHSFTSYKL